MSDAIGQLFQNVINFLTPILIPDWNALVNLLPVFLVIGVVGPIISLLGLGWLIYVLGKPRTRIPYVEPAAPPGPASSMAQPVYPPGEPYCAIRPAHLPVRRDPLRVSDGRDLAVVCPKCGTGRAAYIDTCGTCGLVLKIDQTVPRAATRRSAARRRRRGLRRTAEPARTSGEPAWKPQPRRLFAIGTVVLALAFAATIGHAVLLANGRRSLAGRRSARSRAPSGRRGPASRPARSSTSAPPSRPRGPPTSPRRSPLSGAARWLTVAAFALLAASMIIRGVIVGRGPWGNLFEFSVAFATSILFGYLVLVAPLPDPLDRVHPGRRRAGAGPLRRRRCRRTSSRSCRRSRTRRCSRSTSGLAMLSYGIFATSFAAGVGYLIQGRGDRFSWLPSHRVLDTVAYRAVIIGFPIFATMIILGSWWASIAWSALLGLGPEGDLRPRHVARLRDLPPRPQPARLGRPAGRAAARRRLRDGPRDLLGLALVQRPARLQRPVARAPFHLARNTRFGRLCFTWAPRFSGTPRAPEV